MNELISIIVPVYNVKPYLNKCVCSIMEQSYKNIEILLIDDGSTDGSGEMCDRLAEYDDRITVIHQSNAGLSSARNTGIDNSKGEWIAFLDSDDWVEPTMYEELLRLAKAKNTQISSCAVNYVTFEGMPINITNNTGSEYIYDLKEIIRGLLTQDRIRFEVWNKLWKRSLIGNTRYISGQVSEDVYWDRKMFNASKKMAFIDKPLHNYRVSRPGNTNSKFRIARMCVFEEFDKWSNELIELDMREEAYIIYYIAMRFCVIIYEEAFRTKQKKIIMEDLMSRFNRYHSKIKGKLKISKSMFLFSISPMAYCKVIKMKRKNSENNQ